MVVRNQFLLLLDRFDFVQGLLLLELELLHIAISLLRLRLALAVNRRIDRLIHLQIVTLALGTTVTPTLALRKTFRIIPDRQMTLTIVLERQPIATQIVATLLPRIHLFLLPSHQLPIPITLPIIDIIHLLKNTTVLLLLLRPSNQSNENERLGPKNLKSLSLLLSLPHISQLLNISPRHTTLPPHLQLIPIDRITIRITLFLPIFLLRFRSTTLILKHYGLQLLRDMGILRRWSIERVNQVLDLVCTKLYDSFSLRLRYLVYSQSLFFSFCSYQAV